MDNREPGAFSGPGVQPAWLPGVTALSVVGETFYPDAIRAAQLTATSGGPLAAVLVPQPENPYDPSAVAVCLHNQICGHLPRAVAAIMHPALRQFAGTYNGQLISCPAEIADTDYGPSIVLLLNCGPLGVDPAAVEHTPDLATAVLRLLRGLAGPEPYMPGQHARARAALAAAEADRAEVDVNFARKPDD